MSIITSPIKLFFNAYTPYLLFLIAETFFKKKQTAVQTHRITLSYLTTDLEKIRLEIGWGRQTDKQTDSRTSNPISAPFFQDYT